MNIRNNIFDIIEKDEHNRVASKVYDVFMLIVIIVSIIPLMCTQEYAWFKAIDIVVTAIFIVDYLLRWMTADLKLNKGAWSFVLYPFHPMAIIDLLSILPGINVLNPTFKVLRLSRALRVLRLLKLSRYNSKISLFFKVLKKEKNLLLSVLAFTVFYIFVTALVLFNADPGESFSSFFDALYLSTITLTTVGFGDLYPVTDLGRFISMVSSVLGLIIIALPSGVISASYWEELRTAKEAENKTNQEN